VLLCSILCLLLTKGHSWLCVLLQSRQHLAPAAADRVRALACMAVLGLARDSSIRHILTKLQVRTPRRCCCCCHLPSAVAVFVTMNSRQRLARYHGLGPVCRPWSNANCQCLSCRQQSSGQLEFKTHTMTCHMMCWDQSVCSMYCSWLQVGKLLAELVREPLGPGAGGGSSSRREVNAGSEPGSAGNMGTQIGL
jgi:hypothetical protein